MSEWREVTLGDYAKVLGGYAFKSKDFSSFGDYPVIKIKNVASGSLDMSDCQYVSSTVAERASRFKAENKDILIAMTGSHITQPSSMVGRVTRYNSNAEAYINQRVGKIISRNEKEMDSNFLYHFMVWEDTTYSLANIASGSANQANISAGQIEGLQLMLPFDIKEQQNVAEVLSSLDDKIDLLTRQNTTLEALAQTYFRQLVIEKPNGEGKLGDYITLFDSKRIPLSAMEREKMKDGKLYPYYGAASIMDEINNYIYDGEYILLGEDGTVETDDGYPVLQYATGKFWCNNHAHIIQAKPPYTNYTLWCFLKQCSISHIVTGAVQPKINQANLNSLDIPIASDEMFESANKIITDLFEKILANTRQIQTLQKLRDTLLPKLISGEVKVRA